MAGLDSREILGPNWYREDPKETMFPGEALWLKMKEVLYHKKSEYQDVLVFDSEKFGKVLVLDDIIQCTEKDEFVYHEMMTHIPLYSHPHPKSVLVVGGGDGGVLREIAKHPSVEEIHLCEIDKDVIEVSKKYLKTISACFSNPKVKVFLQDGVEFVRNSVNKYDIIITDCSDLGPAEVLYEEHYFELIKNALTPGGIMCLQGQNLWFAEDRRRISGVVEICKKLFAVTDYALAAFPSYVSFGMVLTSKNKETNFRDPVRPISAEEAETLQLRYYDSQVHAAAFVLPRFMRLALNLKK